MARYLHYHGDGYGDGGGFNLPSNSSTKGSETLVLVPTIPDYIQSHEVHKLLRESLKVKYMTCYRNYNNREMVIQMASASDARTYRGTTTKIRKETYRFEYTTGQSKYYVCPDVHGKTTDSILDCFDNLEIAATVAVGIFRQKDHGPVVALYFDTPPEGIFSIQLRISSVSISFTRACSVCLICQDEHEVSECEEMAEERESKPPAGRLVRFKSRIEAMNTELRALCKDEQGFTQEEAEIAENLVGEWKNIKEELGKLKGTMYERVGHVKP
jgi:hypothetical protein